jgi:hypothetical protein
VTKELSGSFSKEVLSPSINEQTDLFKTKKPPFTHPDFFGSFSEKLVTRPFETSIFPKRGGGFTAVKVAALFDLL